MGEQHEVLAIVASRINAIGEVEYRIRWRGFSQDEDTWQTRQTIEHTAIFADYLENKEAKKDNISEIIGDDDTISDIETEDVSQSTTPLGNRDCQSSPMEISYPLPPEPTKEEYSNLKAREPASSGHLMSHTLPPRVRRLPNSRKRPEPSISRSLSPPTWSKDLLSLEQPERKKQRACIAESKEDWCDPIIFYWRETKCRRSVKLFDGVGKQFDINYTPRMMVGRPSHGEIYLRQRS